MAPSKSVLKQQYDYAKRNGWLIHFATAAAKYDFSTADLLGIASRETNLKNIKGDFHEGIAHGYSLMQLDIDSHRAFVESGQWQDVEASILEGAKALAAKRDEILNSGKKRRATIRFNSGRTDTFIPRPLTQDVLRQCTLAAYNCGIASYYHYSIGNDIDKGTTGKDYSRDVLARSAVFQELLNDQKAPTPSTEQESAAQVASPAEASQASDADLLDAAVSSQKARTFTKTFWAKHGSAFVIWIGSLYEAHNWRTAIVLGLIGAGIVWVAAHNWKRIKPLVIKELQ